MGEQIHHGRVFGADGVRGVAGHDVTAALALDLGVAAAAVLRRPDGGRPGIPVAVVGRDPRSSGDFLEAAVVAGLASAGVDVARVGVIPAPGVAYLTGALNAAFGVVVSAGRSPARDNGITFFGRGGALLPDAVERRIEDQLRPGRPALPGTVFGRVTDSSTEQERYHGHLLSTLSPDGSRPVLAGLRVVADCANGAAYRIAPRVLRRAGAQVIAIGAQPDGRNINDGCGTACLGALAAAVVEYGADAGVAYDGDAGRCLAVDATGQPLDGDQILTVLAAELKEAGRLAHDTVVVTVMSDHGLRTAMSEAGITVIETPAGGKHVSAAMSGGGYVLGGEQSGHIIMAEHATTGDGLLTSLQLLAAVKRRGITMAAAATMMPKYSQQLVSVPGLAYAAA